MTEWLRPVFGRAKTPLPSVAISDRPTSFDDGTESEEVNFVRPRPASRVSSYIGLRVNTPPVPESDTFPNFRKPDSVYHAPSGDQMAELLQAAIMGQSSFEPLPIEYNSCILHVLEAYQSMRMEVGKKQKETEAVRRQHMETIKEFEDMAIKWEAKEKDYQGELKNLEVLLSKTEDGMEKVSLARSKSTVHGSRKIREIIRDLKSIKQREVELREGPFIAANVAGDHVHIPQEGQQGGDVLGRKRRGEKPHRLVDARTTSDGPASPARNTILSHPPERVLEASRAQFQQHEEKFVACRSSNLSLGDMQAHIADLERQRKSESESDSCDSSNEIAGMMIRDQHGRGYSTGDIEKQPYESLNTLRKSRRGISEQAGRAKTKNRMRHSTIVPPQMGFSFNTGDDLSILGQWSSVQNTPGDGGSKRIASGHNSQAVAAEIAKRPPRRNSGIPKLVQEHAKKAASTGTDSQADRILNRFNSTSSVLTAFRAGSDRNSSDDSRSNSIGSHEHIAEKKSTSSEAVTAAIRAVTQNSAIIVSGRQHTSSETSIERRKPSPSQRSD